MSRKGFNEEDKFKHLEKSSLSAPITILDIIPFKTTIDQPFRYLKIYAKNIGNNPPDHPSAGGITWIFADEIMVTN